jgi:ABC-type nitrate/sulfonate/bicarbonate transport system substrate-binding protein
MPTATTAVVVIVVVIAKRKIPSGAVQRQELRLGFVPLTDAAPLIMAVEAGIFKTHGLKVRLSRELGWATIRDKVIHREIDAAHAVAGMPFAATLGLGSIPCDCLTALVLNQHGNAITLSNDLWRRGVRDGATLRNEVVRSRRSGPLTFAVVFAYSSHHFLLRAWLKQSGIDPDRDVRIVIVPPPQMVASLKAGHLDGFCVGEPWNSAALDEGAGWCVATSAELAPGHPEKVLMVRREFAETRADEHLALVASLLEACEYCQAPENRAEVVSTLARREYVGVSATLLRRGLEGRFDFGHGDVHAVPEFSVFHGLHVNEPSSDKAAWVLEHLRQLQLSADSSALNIAFGERVFRDDLFEQATQLRASDDFLRGHEIAGHSRVALTSTR